jgi:hypothetical protein
MPMHLTSTYKKMKKNITVLVRFKYTSFNRGKYNRLEFFHETKKQKSAWLSHFSI